MKINTTRKLSNNEKWASQLPSYSFRTDDADVGEKILSLFLRNGYKVHWQHASKLLDFIKLNNLRPTLKDLIENLQQFGDSSEDNCAIGEQIRSSLCNSRKFLCIVESAIGLTNVCNICNGIKWTIPSVYFHGMCPSSSNRTRLN